jgi:hypothetical protein
MIQTKINEVELHIICDELREKENELISVVRNQIGFDIDVIIKYVESFENYKFEEFISLI